MSMHFHDIHSQHETQLLTAHRIKGTIFDEVLYADDTICISENEQALNWLVQTIEKEGAAYGLKFNKLNANY